MACEMVGQISPTERQSVKIRMLLFNPLVKLYDNMKYSYPKSGHLLERFHELKSHCTARNPMPLLLILLIQINKLPWARQVLEMIGLRSRSVVEPGIL